MTNDELLRLLELERRTVRRALTEEEEVEWRKLFAQALDLTNG